MSRYILSPVKGDPSSYKIFDTLRKKVVKNSSGVNTFTASTAQQFKRDLECLHDNRVKVKSVTDDPKVMKAFDFAAYCHGKAKQRRITTGDLYIVHPVSVMVTVAETNEYTSEMLQAALLHDVVEDTHVSLKQIKQRFGQPVAELVYWLTDISKPEDGNRTVRKAIDREHNAKAPSEAQTIKVADLIDNNVSIMEYAPDFAKVYIPEKEALLSRLVCADPLLRERAFKAIEDYFLREATSNAIDEYLSKR